MYDRPTKLYSLLTPVCVAKDQLAGPQLDHLLHIMLAQLQSHWKDFSSQHSMHVQAMLQLVQHCL
jgi:hypothetical protein